MRAETLLPLAAAALALAGARPGWAQCTSGTQALPYCEPSLDYVGCCAGDALYWCENGVTCLLDCSQNPSCGWNDTDEFYNCGTDGEADPSGSHPLACPGDEDGDGSPFPADCDDGDPNTYPFAEPTCDGVLDNDCNGVTDSNESDDDGDGFTDCDGDCNDFDPDIYPGAPETCGDGIDSDCDDDFESEYDADGDGYPPCAGDCDEGNPAVNPGADEDCDDGIDNDCDGKADGYDGECAGDDDADDDAAGDDDADALSPRAGPYGVRCALDAGRSATTVVLLLGLALAALYRRR